MTYQKCPICDGTGLVIRPPGIAGDITHWDDNGSGPYQCHACGGSGLIEMRKKYGTKEAPK